MVKEVSCIHAGFEDCEFLIRSEAEPELIQIVQQHAENTHNISVSRDHVEKIMRDV